MRQIRGSGGGGKDGGAGGRTPVESPDSLQSRQYARVVDLVSEGEIHGLVSGLKSIYLNDTPLQNSDGSYNFSGVTAATVVGTQSQSYIPGFSSVEAETAVSVPVENATPVVRSISNANANAVRVTVSVPQLTEQNTSNGDLGGTSVSIAIDVQTAGGGYVEKIADTISGKTTSRYQRAYRIELTGAGPWDVRVRRLTADSSSSALNNATYWDSYTEIIDAKLRYPNSALVAMSVDSERFNAIPSRGYECKGLLVRIPSNYNPETRAYAGVWDGTFTTAWTDNPAWCFYDMLTNARYGLGSFIDAAQVDKWSLYEIAKHCDELVPDGYGGMEPRFTCSLYLQSQQEAFKVINDMAAIFCGMAFWGAGSIIPVQDAPADPVKLFTNANVVPSAEGMYFNYAGSSVKTRHTVALVSWNDPADRYKQKIEYVEDAEGIALYGIVQTEVVALGCTSRGQAHRYGRRILYTERMETETISFKAGLDGLNLSPGEVFQTSDPVRAGVRMGGRLLSATVNTATLDAPVTLDGAATYTLWAVLPDGTVQSRAVVTGAGTTSTLAVSPDFTDTPQAMAMWVLAASNLAPETWRAIGISEADGGTMADISALKYSPNKYLEIEQGIVLEALPTSSLSGTQGAPAGFIISEDLYLITPSVVGARITASWQGNAQSYELQYRIKGGNWMTLSTSATSIDIQPVEAGTYEFSLVAISPIGVRSIPSTATKEIYGKTAAPAQVGSFVVTKVGGVAIAVWALVADLDVRVGGRIVVRHSPMVTGATWQDGVVLEEFTGDSVTGLLPLITGTYMVKAKDSSGIYSQASSSFIATEGMVTGFNTIATSAQASDFDGAKDGLALVDGALQLDGSLIISEMSGNVSTWPKLTGLGGIRAEGTYEFDAVMDLATVATRRFEADLTCLSVDTGDFISFRGLVSEWDSISGAVINDCDATLYAATTDDDPTGSPVWSAWTPYFVGDFTCRAIKHRLALTSGSPTHNIQVSNLTVHAKVPV